MMNKVANPKFSCGREFFYVSDLQKTLQEAMDQSFDFIGVPITGPRYYRDAVGGKCSHQERNEPMTRSDLVLTTSDWTQLIVGHTSEWLDLDHPDFETRCMHEKIFREELEFMSHMNIPAIQVSLTSSNCENFARVMLDYSQNSPQHFWVKIPLTYPLYHLYDFDADDLKSEDTWQWWRKFTTLIGQTKKVSVILELGLRIPEPHTQSRWLGEPIKSFVINTKSFIHNSKGFPVLQKPMQLFVQQLYKLNCQGVISGNSKINKLLGIVTYLQYLQHLWSNRGENDNLREFARGYEDYLQIPLQPLQDNLESQTYEIFEKDPVKYVQYRIAINLALSDLEGMKSVGRRPIIVMVLGAGRGPLVNACLAASEETGIKIKLFAIEKNPNAIITLQNLNFREWKNEVTIISKDMRTWQPTDLADIIVSELLGSFGDNELSPECLDGAEGLLQPHGISIPTSYSSYLAPLSSTKLYQSCSNLHDSTKPKEAAYETPYIVYLHNVYLPVTSQKLFTFTHPNKNKSTNERFAKLNFSLPNSIILHGFAGYFSADLYKGTTISIHPETYSADMFSWFPIFFPLRQPVYVNAGQKVEINFWRRVGEHKVWYEWALTEPITTVIHNSNGRSYYIGL